MPQVTISVRIDTEIKKRFEAFCAEVGLNPSVAVNMFIRATLREGRIPFQISADPPLTDFDDN